MIKPIHPTQHKCIPFLKSNSTSFQSQLKEVSSNLNNSGVTCGYYPVTFGKINFCGTSNSLTNLRLNFEINNAFNLNDASRFLHYVNSTLESLSDNSCKAWKSNIINSSDSIKINAINTKDHSSTNKITVDKNAHVQITNSQQGNLFITRDELEQKCQMKDDNKLIIGDGVRFLDPADQNNWGKLPISREWPPDENSIKGLVNLSADKSNQAIMFDTKSTTVGDGYNVKNRGLIAIDPTDSSVIIAVQTQNNNDNTRLAPWAVAPFKVPDGKKALAVFPTELPFIKKYEDAVKAKSTDTEITSREVKDVVLYGQDQWQIDKNNRFMFLDPSKEGGMVGALDSEANWSLFAVEGSDKVYVMRSIYRNSHDDQFKAFSLSGNAKYVEQELTAPRVPKGQKSSLVLKIDQVPLSSLPGISFDKFDKDNFKQQTTDVAIAVRNKITDIRRKTKGNLKPNE
ncbi:MAG: hypothetical protein AB1782_09905 [Cyanobacteriota bacterium]